MRNRLRKAHELTSDFILSKRSSDLLWRDFRTTAGVSSDWVTGFVCYVMARNDIIYEHLMDTVKQLLYRQRHNGGWSYNREVPTDCDSTAWVLMALAEVPTWKPSAIERAIGYIKQHQNVDGGFCTYVIRDGIHKYIRAPNPDWTQGWIDSHPCVTAVSIQSLLIHGEPIISDSIRSSIKYLLGQLASSGVWYTYWWKGYAYCTYNVLRAMALARCLTNDMIKGSQEFIVSKQNKDGGWSDDGGNNSEVYATAFNLLSLMLYPKRKVWRVLRRGIEWLLDQQENNGSWPNTQILRIPPPMVKRPETVESWQINQEGTAVIIADQEGIFTAAAALLALAVFQLTSS